MKKGLILGLSLFMSIAVMAQKVTYQNMDDANKAKLNGVFNFDFDKAYPKIKLDKATTYYTQYFNVEYKENDNGYSATITMISKEPTAKRIIERYFVTLGVKTITAGDEELEVRPFIKKYLLLPGE